MEVETIFAPATVRGVSAVAVIRLSGPRAWAAVRELSGGAIPVAGRAALRTLRGADGGALDRALVLCFAPGTGFTGEEAAELHLHGSRAVVDAVLRALAALPGLRLAEPGEFARRALAAGRMDLPAIEGLADLLAAETEAQRKLALGRMQGALSRQAEAWRGDLLAARALVEAAIDFADEDVPADTAAEAAGRIARVLAGIGTALAGSAAAERIRDGFEVALVGRPNAGKSTLLNAIAGRDVAITSDEPGTTRDVIEFRSELGGLPVTFLDMAGLRDTGGRVESEGVARARARAAAADVRLFLFEPREPREGLGVDLEPGDIEMVAKADLYAGATGFRVSGRTGEGLSALLATVSEVLAARAAGASAVAGLRQRRALELARSALTHAGAALHPGCSADEVAAEYLRQAAHALEVLLGRLEVEEVLGEIFARFCLGK